MSLTIIFRSGQSDQLIVSEKIGRLEITQSDNEYFQHAKFQILSKVSGNIGDSVQIYYNGSRVFDGYLTLRNPLLKGSKGHEYGCVGKTHDLWKYLTPKNVVFSDYSDTIARLIVENYSPFEYSGPTGSGVYLKEIDLSEMTVGDALSRISDTDKSRFFVSGNTVVYSLSNPSGSVANITSNDLIQILDWSNNDYNITNYCIVRGGNGYHPVYKFDPKNQFTIENGWKYYFKLPNIHSVRAFKLYAKSGSGNLIVELYPDYPETEAIWYNDSWSISGLTIDSEYIQLSFESLYVRNDYHNSSFPPNGSLDYTLAQTFKWEGPRAKLYKLTLYFDPPPSEDTRWTVMITDVRVDGQPADQYLYTYTTLIVPSGATSATAQFIDRDMVLETGGRYAFILDSWGFGGPGYFQVDTSNQYDGGELYYITGGSMWDSDWNSTGYDLRFVIQAVRYSRSKGEAEIIVPITGAAFRWNVSVGSIPDNTSLTAYISNQSIAKLGNPPTCFDENISSPNLKLVFTSNDPLKSPTVRIFDLDYWWKSGSEIVGHGKPDAYSLSGSKKEVRPSDISGGSINWTKWIEYEQTVDLQNIPIWMSIEGNNWTVTLSDTPSVIWRESGASTAFESGNKMIGSLIASDYGQMVAIASSQSSIEKYGVRMKQLSLPYITDYDVLEAIAKAEVEKFGELIPEGTIEIKGDISLGPNYNINVYIPEYDISGEFLIRRVTHLFDEKGFRTKLRLSHHEYDLINEIEKLKYKS